MLQQTNSRSNKLQIETKNIMDSEFYAANDEQHQLATSCMKSPKKIAPVVPPKPNKKKKDFSTEITTDCSNEQNGSSSLPVLQRKYPAYSPHRTLDTNVTLDNSLVLEQKLEALAHHKRQMEKNERKNNEKNEYRNSSPLMVDGGNKTYGVPLNQQRSSSTQLNAFNPLLPKNSQNLDTSYSIGSHMHRDAAKATGIAETSNLSLGESSNSSAVRTHNDIYSNIFFDGKGQYESPPPSVEGLEHNFEYCTRNNDEETPPPPSPVSSSYSELRRATDVFLKNYYHSSSYGKTNETEAHCDNGGVSNDGLNDTQRQTFANLNNEFNSYCPTQGSSSPYESIYEPITPRPPSNISSHGIYSNYATYVNRSNLNTNGSAGNISTIGSNSTSRCNTPSYPTLDSGNNSKTSCQEIEVEALTDYLVHSLDTGGGSEENYGTCFKCNQRVLGENSGCTAMEKIYHIACFTCTECQVNLQGKPFYALDGKPFCEYDYVQTLEKCSVCTKPILERILRATGKPYHPQCFTCVICGKSLDGVPFTVDATNQNYCISDFHKKFAPRCCVCKEPIMPELGEEETVRVVALDRSFHFECYKCEDCGLLLSSEVEGRGCYPLDGHVLCMSCNAKRVQMLTNRMAAE